MAAWPLPARWPLESPADRHEAIACRKTETVFLEEQLPVLIVYWTVSVGASGELRFARDVYGRDDPVLRALDSP